MKNKLLGIAVIIILFAFIFLSASCNVGLKNTHCPTNNPNFFSGNKQPKWYKH